MTSALSSDGLLNGEHLRSAFHAAAIHLRDRAAAIDAINVYPVPDGDTGTNMASTLHAAVEAAAAVEPATLSAVLGGIAKGALYGARGNSGVILSQALKGFAAGILHLDVIDAAAVARGLDHAATAAYAAVGNPVEGTMLTVLRAAASSATTACGALPDGGSGRPCPEALEAAVAGAEAAEARTIDQLDILRQAGLPDAGGEGICVILRGILAAVTGTIPAVHALPARSLAMTAPHEGYGFCTEFVVEANGTPIAESAVRAVATDGNEHASLVLVGDESAWHVHVHTSDPEPLLASAATLGAIVSRKVEDMTAQNARWLANTAGAGNVALLALSRGPGFTAIFEGLGARVLELGDFDKPAAGDIAREADALHAAEVVVLPNHRDVLMAASQAASLTRCTLHVVATESLAEGVAAAMAYLPGSPSGETVAALDHARSAVTTIEVTIAAADRKIDRLSIRKGDVIAIIDGQLVAAAANPTAALLAGFANADAPDGCLVTIYTGATVDAETAAAATATLQSALPNATIEAIEGGQGLYPFIASIER